MYWRCDCTIFIWGEKQSNFRILFTWNRHGGKIHTRSWIQQWYKLVLRKETSNLRTAISEAQRDGYEHRPYIGRSFLIKGKQGFWGFMIEIQRMWMNVMNIVIVRRQRVRRKWQAEKAVLRIQLFFFSTKNPELVPDLNTNTDILNLFGQKALYQDQRSSTHWRTHTHLDMKTTDKLPLRPIRLICPGLKAVLSFHELTSNWPLYPSPLHPLSTLDLYILNSSLPSLWSGTA